MIDSVSCSLSSRTFIYWFVAVALALTLPIAVDSNHIRVEYSILPRWLLSARTFSAECIGYLGISLRLVRVKQEEWSSSKEK